MLEKLLSKAGYLSLILFILFLCAGCSPCYKQDTVQDVIDGDTVLLKDGGYLRLIGIDTPEIRKKTSQGFLYDPQPFSLDAKNRLSGLVSGKEINLEFDKERRDKYKRLLGYIFLETDKKKVFINKELVLQGLAVVSVHPPNLKYIQSLIEAQRIARQEKIGLWQEKNTILPSQAFNHIGQIKVVRGRVLSAYNSGRAIFLNFGTDYKEDFTVIIFKRAWKYFLSKGIQPRVYYLNKIVEVAGKLRDYNGPEIIINHPSEIRIIEQD